MTTSADKAILLADVTGSTPLYEKHGDEQASLMVFECVEGMQDIAKRRSGQFVRSKGDDVLCLFDDASEALMAAREIVQHGAEGSVSVHAGLHWGTVVWRGSELFGGAVNVAARLASRATDNEVLLSGLLSERLPPMIKSELRPMGEMTLKGTAAPTQIYGLLAANDGDEDGSTQLIAQTQLFDIASTKPPTRSVVRLGYDNWRGQVEEGQSLTIGRSAQCDLHVPEAWVSRVHASVSIAGGIVELKDSSAAGCSLTLGDHGGFFLHRQTMVLTGSGVIELGTESVAPTLPRILFQVVTED